MKKSTLSYFIGFLFVAVIVVSCTTAVFSQSRVLKVDKDTAIVEGIGFSKAEARLNAEKAAVKVFPEYTETKEAEYSSVDQGSNKFTNTKIICTMYIMKK